MRPDANRRTTEELILDAFVGGSLANYYGWLSTLRDIRALPERRTVTA